MATVSESQATNSRIAPTGWVIRGKRFVVPFVIVLCLLICVLGYVTLRRIPVDILPSFKTPAVQVLTLYPGM
ncbi:MAG: efflux RND transporter permease subunit [Pirellula sp.]|nr:efflux RND transporter permease subunit [Pirellula sp.]